MLKISFIICFVFLFSCTANNKSNDKEVAIELRKDTSTQINKTNKLVDEQNKTAEDSLQVFANGEIVLYCVLLPLNEFTENFNDGYVVKAQHKFVLKNNPKAFDYIDVQGFFIDKENNFNTILFYKRDIADIEDEGLGIDTSYMHKAKNYYIIKGYLPNDMNKKFTQVTWINEDKVNVTIGYPKNKEALWNKRIETMLTYGMKCKN